MCYIEKISEYIFLLFFPVITYCQNSWTLEECINYALKNSLGLEQSSLQESTGKLQYDLKMTADQITTFEKTQAQIKGLHIEIGTLSKKSPNDALNKFKLKIINQLLSIANVLLVEDYKPLEGFDNFEEDNLPTNSDVVLILEQYLNCLELLRADNISTKPYETGWFWIVKGKVSNLKTYKPLKLKE